MASFQSTSGDIKFNSNLLSSRALTIIGYFFLYRFLKYPDTKNQLTEYTFLPAAMEFQLPPGINQLEAQENQVPA